MLAAIALLIVAMSSSCGPSLDYGSVDGTGDVAKEKPAETADEASSDSTEGSGGTADHTPPAAVPGGELEVAYLDVGQGDGIVVISPIPFVSRALPCSSRRKRTRS